MNNVADALPRRHDAVATNLPQIRNWTANRRSLLSAIVLQAGQSMLLGRHSPYGDLRRSTRTMEFGVHSDYSSTHDELSFNGSVTVG